MGFLKGKNKKIEEAVNEEQRQKEEAFLKDLREVISKHKIDIKAELRVTVDGIFPIPVLKKIEEPKTETKPA